MRAMEVTAAGQVLLDGVKPLQESTSTVMLAWITSGSASLS